MRDVKMKILYIGTVCDLQEYEKLLKKCKNKQSISTIVFESSLLYGFSQNNVEVDVISFPMIPNFPDLKKIYIGNKKENLKCGYKNTWLKTINVPFLKQFSRKADGHRLIKKWLEENCNEECAILSYSIPPFLAKEILSLSKKYNVKSFAIITDLLRDMYINSQDKKIVSALKNYYLSQAITLQGEFDGYVYLTEAMKAIVGKSKPYVVVEGIADISDAGYEDCHQEKQNYIMYAGMLEKNFGINNLIDAFESADLKETQLWLFGHGSATDDIILRSQKNPRIVFWGQKSHDEVLKYEKGAELLVNLRSAEDEFTKYSFPSKTIEYMLSGTPVLTTQLPGIPQEYYSYTFSCKDNSVSTLKNTLEYIFSLSVDDRAAIGKKAKSFVSEEKNALKQSNRIINFVSEVVKQ